MMIWMERYESFVVGGKNLRLTCDTVLPPPLVTAMGGRRWLEAYSPPPRSKAVQKRFRTTLMDGMLVVLRAMRECMLLSVVAFGEGALILMGLLSSELRAAAFVERRVLAEERLELESFASNLEYTILIAPHSYPIRSYMPLLREYVPEISVVAPPVQTKVMVVAPLKDALSSVAQECSNAIHGSVLESRPFCRTCISFNASFSLRVVSAGACSERR